MDQATYDKIYQSTLAQIQAQQAPKPKMNLATPEAQDAYLASIGFGPKPTGLIKGTVRALGRGLGGAVEQLGHALEYDQNQRPDLVNRMGAGIAGAGEYLRDLVKKPVAEPGSRKEAYFGAMESVPASLAYGLPALAGGALAGPVGALAGGAVTMPIMHQAAAQDAYETLTKSRPDLPEAERRRIAEQSGMWEAAPEAAGNVIEGTVAGMLPGGKAIKSLADVARATLKPGVKAFARNVATTLPTEMATEAVTGYGQTKLLKDAGVTDVTPMEGALKGAESAAYMTPFIGMLGGGVNSIKAKILENSITKPIPTQGDTHSPMHLKMRETALATLDNNMKQKLDPDVYANQWMPAMAEIQANPNKGFDLTQMLTPAEATTTVTPTIPDQTTPIDLTTTPEPTVPTAVAPEVTTPLAITGFEDIDEIFGAEKEVKPETEINPELLTAIVDLNYDIPNMGRDEYVAARKAVFEEFGQGADFDVDSAVADYDETMSHLGFDYPSTEEVATTTPIQDVVETPVEPVTQPPVSDVEDLINQQMEITPEDLEPSPAPKKTVKKVAKKAPKAPVEQKVVPTIAPEKEAVVEVPSAPEVVPESMDEHGFNIKQTPEGNWGLFRHGDLVNTFKQETSAKLARTKILTKEQAVVKADTEAAVASETPKGTKTIIRRKKDGAEVVNVTEDKAGVPSEERKREEPISPKPLKRASKEEVSTGGDVQAHEKEGTSPAKQEELTESTKTDYKEIYHRHMAAYEDKSIPVAKRKDQLRLAKEIEDFWVSRGGKLDELTKATTKESVKELSKEDRIKALKDEQDSNRDKIASMKDSKSPEARVLRERNIEIEDQIEAIEDEDAQVMSGFEYKPTSSKVLKSLDTLPKAFDYFDKEIDQDSPYRVLMNRLRKLGIEDVKLEFTETPIQLKGDPAKKALGVYRDSERRIVVAQREVEPTLRTILHESVHAVTSRRLKEAERGTNSFYKTAADNMVDLYNDVVKVAKIRKLKNYGFTNVREFVAEAFTNPQFQEVLRSIPVNKTYENRNYKYSLWDKFVVAVAKVLNLKPTDQLARTALERVLTLGNTLMSDEFNGGPDVLSDDFHKLDVWKDVWDDVSSKYKGSITSPTGVINATKDAIGEHAPSVSKFLRNAVVMPFFYAERLKEKSGKLGDAVARMVKASENKTAHYNTVLNRLASGEGDVKGFVEIGEMVNKLDQSELLQFRNLNIFGDMENKEYKTIGDVPKNSFIGEVTPKAFEAYRALREFSNKVFDQMQDEIIQTAVYKYRPSMQKKLKEFMKTLYPGTNFSKHLIKSKLDSILSSAEKSDKDLVKMMVDDIMESKLAVERIRTQLGKIEGHLPRIRKSGQYKLTVTDDEGNRLFMSLYATPFLRNLDKEAIEKDPKTRMLLNYKPGTKLNFNEEYVQKNQYQKLGTTPTASELQLEEALLKAKGRKEITDKQFDYLKKVVAARAAEVVLGDSAGRHRISRVKDYIEGFETDPMKAYEVMLENMSRSIAKSRYITEQFANYKEVKKHDPQKQVSEYMMEYLISTMRPKTTADQWSAKARYITTIYFLAGNVGAAIINSLQNAVIGIPELSRHIPMGEATKLMHKYMKLVTPEAVKHQYRTATKQAEAGRIAPVSKDLPEVLQYALSKYRTSGLNFDTQTFLQSGANEEVYGEQVWNTFKKVGDTLMLPFKAMESANREAALLAYMDMKLKKEGVDANTEEFDPDVVDAIYKDAVHFVSKVHFMGAGNLPVYLQRSPFARTLLAMQSYGLNFWNLMYNNLTSADKTQFNAALKTFGIIAALGGAAGAIPLADEMNKIFKWLLGRDVKQEATRAVGKMTHPEFANLLAYGLPSVFGVNIANNVSLRLPIVSNLLGGNDLGVAVAGAPGSVIMRQWKALNYITNGQFGKAIGIGSPEALGRVFRAYQEFDQGFTSTKGSPVYFKGKKLKASAPEALLKGLVGFKTTKEAAVADVRFSEYELKQHWQAKKTIAVNKFLAGDKNAVQDFNETLRSKGPVSKLISPIKGADILKAKTKKPSKQATAYEKEFEG